MFHVFLIRHNKCIYQNKQYTYLQVFICHSCSVHSTAPIFKPIHVRSPYKTDVFNISYFKKETNAILRQTFEYYG